MVSRDDIVAAARAWIGTPWRHQGRTKAGIDCAGLVVLVAGELGLSDHDVAGYPRRPVCREFISQFSAHMDPINPRDARPGDVLLFREDGSAHTCHAGLVASSPSGLTVIHAYARRRKVVEEPIGDLWGTHTHGFRFRGIDQGGV